MKLHNMQTTDKPSNMRHIAHNPTGELINIVTKEVKKYCFRTKKN